LGYSMYDTIIVFDRVRENIPRMPRAAFSQIVNRSMSEVLTRSIATTFCTLMPVLALLFFGGNQTLQDFAFALLIGVASGAYSSIFIASPVLTHWKEREPGYRARRRRIEADSGHVPAYAASGADIEPVRARGRGRPGRLTTPEPEGAVSTAEFEQMKRDLELETKEPSRHTSTLSQRLSHKPEAELDAAPPPRPKPRRRVGGGRGGAGTKPPTSKAGGDAAELPAQEADGVRGPKAPAPSAGQGNGGQLEPIADAVEANGGQLEPIADAVEDNGDGFERAPDVAENEGVAQTPKPKPAPKSARTRNRRHGRRR
jgi:Protein export membrane protein